MFVIISLDKVSIACLPAPPSRISFPSENNRADVTCRSSSLPDCGFAAALKHCCHHLGSKKSGRVSNASVVTDARTSRARI